MDGENWFFEYLDSDKTCFFQKFKHVNKKETFLLFFLEEKRERMPKGRNICWSSLDDDQLTTLLSKSESLSSILIEK